MNSQNLTITSELDNIRKVESFIEQMITIFKIPEKLQGRITLAIIEAVTNSILFGNQKDPHKTVKLYATKGSRKIVVTVEDEGKGFDFHHYPDPTTPNELMKITGRGLYLMITLTDDLIFARNGAKVIMTFSLIN